MHRHVALQRITSARDCLNEIEQRAHFSMIQPVAECLIVTAQPFGQIINRRYIVGTVVIDREAKLRFALSVNADRTARFSPILQPSGGKEIKPSFQ